MFRVQRPQNETVRRDHPEECDRNCVAAQTGFRVYLEGHGDLVSGLIIGIIGVIIWAIGVIKLLIKSP